MVLVQQVLEELLYPESRYLVEQLTSSTGAERCCPASYAALYRWGLLW